MTPPSDHVPEVTPYPKGATMTPATAADAHAAHQLETILSDLIGRTKTRLQDHLDARDIDAMRDELATLTALEACRHHALTDHPDPLDTITETGYRILNNHLEVNG